MSKTELFSKEDYWAIWIGFALLLLGLFLFFSHPPKNLEQRHRELNALLSAENKKAPYKTVAWYEAFDKQQKIKSTSEPVGKFLSKLTTKPGSWSTNPLDAFLITPRHVKATKAALAEKYNADVSSETITKAIALADDKIAAANSYDSLELNEKASFAIKRWRAVKKSSDKLGKKYNAKATNKIPYLLVWMLILALLFGFGLRVMGQNAAAFFKGFVFVFLMAVVSYTLAGHHNMKAAGIGYAAWAIILGLLTSNTIGTPGWVKPALRTEFFIKTGLVLLGAEILFGKIMSIGLPGIFVAWVVTPIVLVSTFWFGQKVLKIKSKTLNITISADMSVCGVSAAVATAAACKASKEELTLAVGLSMAFTSVMMILEPAFIHWAGMPEVLGGAWIGGTMDATGAVVAAGAFLGDKTLNVAATIKMIQNVLIGIIAFAVAVYFATKVEKTGAAKVGWGEIWKRFPKFILGFIGTSILFSAIYALVGDSNGYTLIDQGVIRGFTKNIRGWLFCLAFVSIGLSTNFKELKEHFKGGTPLLLYVCGQAFNLCLTLLMAYLMFYIVFPYITENI